MKLLLSCLEPSANLHVAPILPHLKGVELCGIFGERFSEFGTPIYESGEFSAMGFVEVVPLIFKARHAIAQMCELARGCDAVLLVDSPAFNLPLARALRRANIAAPITYYILPQVWAWRRGRARVVGATCDNLASILPFERDFYERATFVGHPLIEEIAPKFALNSNLSEVLGECAEFDGAGGAGVAGANLAGADSGTSVTNGARNLANSAASASGESGKNGVASADGESGAADTSGKNNESGAASVSSATPTKTTPRKRFDGKFDGEDLATLSARGGAKLNAILEAKLAQKQEIIAFLPGSRKSEISRLMPVFRELAGRFGAARKLLVVPPHLRENVRDELAAQSGANGAGAGSGAKSATNSNLGAADGKNATGASANPTNSANSGGAKNSSNSNLSAAGANFANSANSSGANTGANSATLAGAKTPNSAAATAAKPTPNATAKSTPRVSEIYGDVSDFELAFSTHEALCKADFAFICSGTATLEAALIATPFVLCYKANALDIFLARRLVKLKHVGLANIVFDFLAAGGENAGATAPNPALREPVNDELIGAEVTAARLYEAYLRRDWAKAARARAILREYLAGNSAKNVAKLLKNGGKMAEKTD